MLRMVVSRNPKARVAHKARFRLDVSGTLHTAGSQGGARLTATERHTAERTRDDVTRDMNVQ